MPNDNPSIEDLTAKPGAVAASSASNGSPVAPSDESSQQKLASKMEDIGLQGKEKETQAKSKSIGLEYIDLTKTPLDREALPLLKRSEIEELKAIIFLNQDGQLRMATTEPGDAVKKKMSELAEAFRAQASLYLISDASYKHALKEYDRIPKKSPPQKEVAITAEDLDKYKEDAADLSKLPDKIKDIPLTDVITIIFAAAIQTDVSDIHIEAEADGIKIRFRIDGILHEMAVLSKELWKQVISRIKLLSKLKMNVTEKPQDGRITIKLPDDKLDIRVSTLPTSFGESVVMRLLRSSAVGLDFKKLGVRGKSFMDLKREVERPNGMILTTGPTGSGKTTTLYATLNKLNNDETKIITLEDPIEYKLPGINQSQVDKSKDYDFAKGLRSILRQDPDVVMVGEIRDLETADVAINAALTGHLVLSTLHTNDAAGAIPRFLSMGVKPFLLSPSLNAVIGQRLVRKICEKCKEELELDNEVITRVMNIINSIPENSGFVVDKENQMKFYKGKGCDACNKEGYKGRTGIYEVFTLTPEIEKMILSGKVSEYDVKQVTQKEGMVSMVQDGILKAMDGITTVEEIFRVTEE